MPDDDDDYGDGVQAYAVPRIIAGGLCHPSAASGSTVGLILGEAAGEYVGSQFGHGNGKLAATAVGIFVGGLVGRQHGSRYSNDVRVCAAEALAGMASDCLTYDRPPPPLSLFKDDCIRTVHI